MLRERHKAIAIPMSTVNNIQKFLIVHDRRYKEWTFVTGGCRKREIYNPLRCALRELEEETRGLLNLKKGFYSYFKFTNTFQEPKDIEDGIEVLNHYHVYILNCPMTSDEHYSFIKLFTQERIKMDTQQIPFRKNYDENDDCRFESIESIQLCSNVWHMIQSQVISNPEFHTQLTSTVWTPFTI